MQSHRQTDCRHQIMSKGTPPHPKDNVICCCAGIPAEQQVLCHAGLHLKDHLALSDHRLDAFTLSDEVRRSRCSCGKSRSVLDII